MIELSKIKPIVEALLFASDSPITENRIKSVIEELTVSQIQKIIAELNIEYENNNRSFQISRIGGGFQIVTRQEFAGYIKKFYKGRNKSRLSRAGLEALSIIAFKQPISRPEIDAIRGVNSDGVVKTLLERNLIQIAGRAEGVGHALLYSTTEEFLQHFGINEISELPKPKEIEELLGSAQEELPFASNELDQDIADKIAALENPDEEETAGLENAEVIIEDNNEKAE